mmetsp:Transcript_9995/g.22354  ORF Transcript_9995/g.22354 Transcript_9995/m.22354 type:complete len:362 (+) Transcript_9995:48-1133(+)
MRRLIGIPKQEQPLAAWRRAVLLLVLFLLVQCCLWEGQHSVFVASVESPAGWIRSPRRLFEPLCLSPVPWAAARQGRGCVCRPSAAPVARSALPWEGLFEEDSSAPTNTEEAAEALQEAMMALFDETAPGTKSTRTRFTIDMPKAMSLGVEGGPVDALEPPPLPVKKSAVARADRELAAAWVQMFQELKISERLCVGFRSEVLANTAKRTWQTWGDSHIFAFPSSEESLASEKILRRKLLRRNAGPGTILLAVAPRESELKILDKLLDAYGKNVIVFLLNARLRATAPPGSLKERYARDFDTAFHLGWVGPNREGFLFRAMREKAGPTPWFVAKRLASGEWKEVLRAKEEPSTEAISAALA